MNKSREYRLVEAFYNQQIFFLSVKFWLLCSSSNHFHHVIVNNLCDSVFCQVVWGGAVLDYSPEPDG